MTLRFLVSGSVQGVGYRYFVLVRAGAIGVNGWVRNLADGRVEVVARGSKEALESLADSLQQGPRHARVTDVDKSEVSDELDVGNLFEIR